MRRLVRLMLALAAIAAVLWLGWTPIRAVYFQRRAVLEERRVSLAADVERYLNGVKDHDRVEGAIQEFVARTLGGDLQTVDHRLRSRLNRIGEDLELDALTVGTGRVRRLESPARSQFERRGEQLALRDEIDFIEVEAWIAGRGTLERVLQLVHRLEAEPWLKRVQQVRVEPKENGKRFSVSLRLVTLFLPGREPGALPPPADDPAGFARYEGLLHRNQFQVPPKPVQQPVATPAPAPDPGFPLGQWVLTGIAAGPSAVEVWLLSSTSGETRRLAVGESWRELQLVSADGLVAEFRLGDTQFKVAVGRPLSERLR